MTDTDSRAQILLEKLMEVQVAFHSSNQDKARELGLSVAQATVALDLAGHPGSNLHEVCGRLGWPKSSVSRLVDELVRKGLATRTIPEDNRRAVLLSVAPEVRSHCLEGAAAAFFPGAKGSLSQEDAASIGTALDRMLALMKP
jgi:DNA-binding MarR family transcriptional regulator